MKYQARETSNCGNEGQAAADDISRLGLQVRGVWQARTRNSVPGPQAPREAGRRGREDGAVFAADDVITVAELIGWFVEGIRCEYSKDQGPIPTLSPAHRHLLFRRGGEDDAAFEQASKCR